VDLRARRDASLTDNLEDRIPAGGTKTAAAGEYEPSNSGFGDTFKAGRKPKPVGDARKP
jgi:hypothetical protein